MRAEVTALEKSSSFSAESGEPVQPERAFAPLDGSNWNWNKR